jgi:hypothetical protein
VYFRHRPSGYAVQFCEKHVVEFVRLIEREVQERIDAQLPVGRRLEGLVDY